METLEQRKKRERVTKFLKNEGIEDFLIIGLGKEREPEIFYSGMKINDMRF